MGEQQANPDSYTWRLQTLETNLSRVEGKVDSGLERLDQRISAQSKYLIEKLDEVSKEISLSRSVAQEVFVPRREIGEFMLDVRQRLENLSVRLERDVVPRASYEERHQHLIKIVDENRQLIDAIYRERREDGSRTNLALITAALSFIGSALLHFLPPLKFGP